MTHEADVIGDRAHFAQLDNALKTVRFSAMPVMVVIMARWTVALWWSGWVS